MKIEDKTTVSTAPAKQSGQITPFSAPVAPPPPAPEPPSAPAPKPTKSAVSEVQGGKWEYQCAKLPLNHDLQGYAKDRWELVSVVVIPHDPNRGFFYFKRAK